MLFFQTNTGRTVGVINRRVEHQFTQCTSEETGTILYLPFASNKQQFIMKEEPVVQDNVVLSFIFFGLRFYQNNKKNAFQKNIGKLCT